jgi:hypothetical protein
LVLTLPLFKGKGPIIWSSTARLVKIGQKIVPFKNRIQVLKVQCSSFDEGEKILMSNTNFGYLKIKIKIVLQKHSLALFFFLFFYNI